MSNDASFNQYAVADRVAGIFFSENLQPEPPDVSRSSFVSTDFDSYAGRYEMEDSPGLVFTFRRDGDRFLSEAAGDEVQLNPLSKSKFQVKGQDARIEFHTDQIGKVTSATIFHQGEHSLRRLANGEVVGRSIDLSPYAGNYHSEELATDYQLTIEAGTLVLRHRLFKAPVQLRPMQGERFSGNGPTASLTFERDAHGHVEGFHVGNGSAREYVWFERIN